MPGLFGVDLQKVNTANCIYKGMIKFLLEVHSLGILWSVENPKNSLLWEIPDVVQLSALGHYVCFDACCYGGERLTGKAFLTNCRQLCSLEQKCSGGHPHKPFGKIHLPSGQSYWATRDEAAYPRPLCLQIVALISQELGVQWDPSASVPNVAAGAAALNNRQLRGRKCPPLVPEYKLVLRLFADAIPQVDSKRRLLQPFQNAPKGSKLLSSTKVGKLGGPDVVGKFLVVIGVYHSKTEFADRAIKCTHPIDQMFGLDDALLKCIFSNLVQGPAAIAQKRVDFFRKWTSRANELSKLELRLRKGLDADVARVLKGKRILLLQEIAESFNWPDVHVFTELKEGFEIVGDAPHSGVFSHEFRPRVISAERLKESFKFLKPALLGKVKSHELGENASELWEKTCAEADAGLLEGPLEEEEVNRRFGESWVPVRRFGVIQSSMGVRKLRPIDDFSENKINQAFGYADKLDLRALDELVGTIRIWTVAVKGTGVLDWKLSDGTHLQGRVHPVWREGTDWLPSLTTLDLKQAYKQFPISAACRALGVIALKRPGDGKIFFFISRALPFGSTASVLHFNRLSRLFWRVGLELALMWTTFFDDFPTMSPKALETSSMQCLVSLGELLGFQCSLEKLRPFANSAAVLGVEVDCSSVAEGRLLIRNKEGRTSEVSEVITQALSVGRLSLKEYQRVMGRIQYADAQIMGRTGKLAMAEIRSWVRNAGGDLVLGSDSRAAYKLLLHRFSAAEDRAVPCSPTGKTAYIFTDGASEGDVHTIGGILFLEGKQPHFFACHVPKSLALEWSKSLDHLIGPVEAYALVMARVLWHQHVAGLRCVYFVDNFAVLDAFIKGTSPSSHFREALRSFEEKERVEASWPWFSRVPSDSNCADDPSRGEFTHLLERGYVRDKCLCPYSSCEVTDL